MNIANMAQKMVDKYGGDDFELTSYRKRSSENSEAGFVIHQPSWMDPLILPDGFQTPI